MRAALIAVALTVWPVLFAQDAMGHENGKGAQTPDGDRPFEILKTLPFDASAYQPAAAELVNQGIPDKFGREEWAAVVLTNEVHQHVGIYSIVGAKMGVRARQLLGAPTRTVSVTVETGSRPPVSCVIDGLQVALGSTLAQDLIHVPTTPEPKVAATFEYKGHTLRLSLKPEFEKRIADSIAAATKQCGDLTPAYFKQIETFSYRVWAEFDRRTIFDEQMQPIPQP